MSEAHSRTAILMINFGEPDEPTLEKVEPFLERIFLQNAGLEPDEAAVARAKQLARDRAPGLIEEYVAIGSSPLNAQADAQAAAVERALRSRGWNARTYSVYQFTEPSIEAGLEAARADGAERLVALPVYPLCGHSTTVASLAAVRAGVERMGWKVPLVGLSGWHAHPAYLAMRAEHVRAFMAERALDPKAPDTLLYFSAHGTPVKYLEEGSRYDRYVEEHCRQITEIVGARRAVVGFQNHTNRRVKWTQPDNEDAIREVPESQLVVVPVSFMHEQSETLAELDHELREFVEGLGKQFHRVPVPHDAPAFAELLADLVEEGVRAPTGGRRMLAPCRCAPGAGTWCTNGARDLPPSPYGGGPA